jgi:ribosomal protein L14
MNKYSVKLIKKIVTEYTDFVKKTENMVKDVKKATIISLKKVMKLKDGDIIHLDRDGSLEIESKNDKEVGDD